MQTNIDMPTALRMMSGATRMPHVFEDVGECVELGGGDILCALQLLGRVYLACLNWDTKRVCVTPAERWEPDNLRDCIDGTPLLSLDRRVGELLAEMAGCPPITTSAQPAATSH